MNSVNLIKAGTMLGLLAAAGLLGSSLAPQAALAAGIGAGAGSGAPATMYLTGVIRDFRHASHPQGHPDFERGSAGFNSTQNNIANTLSADGKPVYTGTGKKWTKQWKDSAARPIAQCLYNPALGDVAGTWGTSYGGAVTAARFPEWFTDTLGVNMSKPLTLTFNRVESSGSATYVFDAMTDPTYSSLGGFFPINGQLFGNYASTGKNFHFTFELNTEFTYDADAGQVFKFRGDDDVWVFINGKKVIDLGGVHSAQEQTVDLNRLGLTDGEKYTLAFFYAERNTTQANCRIETNLVLESVQLPSISAAFD
jgi:fibro-slime domain-containing protein